MNEQLGTGAYLIAAAAADTSTALTRLKENGVAVHGNPDLYVRTYKQFGIDEARELRERSAARAIGERRYFVIGFTSATSEAQNALLKTIEEPPADAAFYFITPAPHVLLPTLRSRMQLLGDAASPATSVVDARQFLAASKAKRLEMLKPLLAKEEDGRDISAIFAFFGALERELARATRTPEGMQGIKASAEALYRARAYAGDKGALLKPLLEQVALLAT